MLLIHQFLLKKLNIITTSIIFTFTTCIYNIDGYKIDIIIVSPPHYKIRVDGNCNKKVNEIIEKSNKYSCIIKLEIILIYFLISLN